MKTKLLLIIAILVIPSCITYHGKYGTYTATPEGVVISPHYAK